LAALKNFTVPEILMVRSLSRVREVSRPTMGTLGPGKSGLGKGIADERVR
jgi:hypothetical protein